MSEFIEMRRKRQQLSEEESIGILQEATAGTLALLGDNGYPYALPISYVYADGKLYFHSALEGHKVNAIRNCDKAAIEREQNDACISSAEREQARPGVKASLATDTIPTMKRVCRRNWSMAMPGC